MRGRFWAKAVVAIAVLAMGVSAQTGVPWTDTTGTRHPCTGEAVVKTWVEDFILDRGVKTTVTVLGVSKSWNVQYYLIPQSEKSEFIHGVIAVAGLNCGSGGATNLPAQAAASTFQQTVFVNTAKPRMAAPTTAPAAKPLSKTTTPAPVASADESVTLPAAAPSGESAAQEAAATTPTEPSTESGKAVELVVAEKEAGTAPALPPNNVTTDLEWNAFSMNKQGGNNYSLRANYSRTLSGEKVTIGGTLVVNTMIMLDKLFFNNALNVSGTYLLTETSSLERRVGGSVNTFIVDKAFYGTPFGMSIVGSFSDNWFVNEDNIVTYGGMVQQSFVGDIKTTLLTTGVLFGLPILDRYAINPSCVAALNLFTAGKKGKVDVTSPFMLQPALNGSIYFTKLFTLDAGLKTTLFIKDYSDFILTVGATVLF
jgi:hypothetical protein